MTHRNTRTWSGYCRRSEEGGSCSAHNYMLLHVAMLRFGRMLSSRGCGHLQGGFKLGWKDVFKLPGSPCQPHAFLSRVSKKAGWCLPRARHLTRRYRHDLHLLQLLALVCLSEKPRVAWCYGDQEGKAVCRGSLASWRHFFCLCVSADGGLAQRPRHPGGRCPLFI